MTDRRQDELVRPRNDRVIAGVAAGLARKLGIGSGWIRIGFVLLLAVGGLGIPAYGIGWLVIRDEDESESVLDRRLGDLENSSTWLGAGLIVLAGVILVGATDLIRGDMVFAAALFLFGILLYRGKTPSLPRRGDKPGSPPGSDPGGGSAAVPESRLDPDTPVSPPIPRTEAGTEPEIGPDVHVAAGTTYVAAVPTSVAPGSSPSDIFPPVPGDSTRVAPVKATREPSQLGRLTFAAMLMTLGVMAILDNARALDLDLRHYLAAAVIVTGVGLLTGAFLGRARGLIVLGILLLPLLVLASAVRIDVFGEYGERVVAPQAVEDLDPSYIISAGRLHLDLTGLDFDATDEPVTVEARVGFGEIVVIAPADLDVIVDADVGIGRLDIAYADQVSERGGFDLLQQVDNADGDPRLVLDLEVGVGNLEMSTP